MSIELKKCLASLNLPKASWVGLREVKENKKTLLVRDERPELSDVSTTHGIMVEVLVDGQFGYAATHDVSVDGVKAAASKALEHAHAASKYKVFPFSEKERPKAVGEYVTKTSRPFDALSTQELFDILLKTNKAMNVSNKIVKRDTFSILIDTESRFVSSNGSDVSQHFYTAMSHISAIAKEGTQVQKRTRFGNTAHSFQCGSELFQLPEFLIAAEKVGREAVELLTAEECPNETTDLVLAPDQMVLQIHESIGHPLELDRILGDERNYAGFSFVRPGDFGKLKYGSPLMNISFDPTVENEIASYGFDDCGNKATKEFLIKDGLLVRGLGSLESQSRLAMPGVANYRACAWNRPPIDRMANINMEPGNKSLEQILGSIENGVYMETNRSWSIDDYRNKFQFGCEYAKKIENGKLTKTLRNPNYRGVTSSFWHNLFAVGDSSTFKVFGTPNCGKGEPNQSIRVGHATPVCAFRNVEVFGGAE